MTPNQTSIPPKAIKNLPQEGAQFVPCSHVKQMWEVWTEGQTKTQLNNQDNQDFNSPLRCHKPTPTPKSYK